MKHTMKPKKSDAEQAHMKELASAGLASVYTQAIIQEVVLFPIPTLCADLQTTQSVSFLAGCELSLLSPCVNPDSLQGLLHSLMTTMPFWRHCNF